MTEDTFTLIAEPRKSPLRFFLLVFAFSLPFWLSIADDMADVMNVSTLIVHCASSLLKQSSCSPFSKFLTLSFDPHGVPRMN